MIICVSCWRWLRLLFSVLDMFGLPLCARQQTLQWGGQPFLVCDLRPCPLPQRRWSLSFGCSSVDSSPLFWTLIPEACNQCWNVSLLTSDTEYWTESCRARHQHRPERTVCGLQGLGEGERAAATAKVPSQLVCTMLYSPSPCVSPPLSSIAVEKPCWCMFLTSVQMHLFGKENETLTYLE